MNAARFALGLVLSLLAAFVLYRGLDIWPLPWIGGWLLVAIAIGLVVGRWPALLLAPIPWPLAMGAGLLTGRVAFLGEGWQLIALLTVGAGLVGIGAGLGLLSLGRRLRRG